MPTFAPRQSQKPASSNLVRPNAATLGPDRRGSHAEEPDIGWLAPRPAFDFSRISIHPTPPSRVEATAAVSTPGDIYEREADRVARQVMRVHDPLQRRPEQERPQIRPIGSGDLGHTTVPPIVHEVLSAPGQPLDAATQAFFEPRFGHDFSGVRVHADERAGDSARAVNASAYTVGRHLVFGAGQYSPATAQGRRLVAHELVHSVQQGSAADPQLVGGSGSLTLQRDVAAAPALDLKASEETTISSKSSATEGEGLRNGLWELANKNVTDYVTYKNAISKATPIEKRVALNTVLLAQLRDTLDHISFARCVELLGRRAPTFSELKNNSIVSDAVQRAWDQSNVGGDFIARPREQGGWVFMNLIDGTLHVEWAGLEETNPTGPNWIILDPAPDVKDSVVVAVFHTHPFVGGPKAKPSRRDKIKDETDGVPDLVAANQGTDPKVFQIYLSGPPVRKHLASDRKFPGRSGGIPP